MSTNKALVATAEHTSQRADKTTVGPITHGNSSLLSRQTRWSVTVIETQAQNVKTFNYDQPSTSK